MLNRLATSLISDDTPVKLYQLSLIEYQHTERHILQKFWTRIMNRLYIAVCALATFVCLASSQSGNILHYVIEENQPTSTVIGDLMTDANLTLTFDADDTGRLRFGVIHGGGGGYVTVNATSGVLLSTASVDREVVCVGVDNDDCVISVDVVVTSSTYFNVIHVRIAVTDVNDNAPTFPQPEVTLHIPETARTGSGFDIPVADDPDAGVNRIRTYYIVPDRSPFRVVVTETTFGPSLQLVVTQQLDRETQDSYNLIVVAVDGGAFPLSGTIRIYINIQDTNDNIPRFNQNTYTADVTENACVSSPILTISASDPDLGEFGRIRYGFSDRTYATYGDTFRINETSGDITLERALDYETEMTYRLTATAVNSGGAVLGRAAVVIHVNDVNDNDPEITFTVLTASGLAAVSKSADPSTFVAHVSVADADSKQNSAVSCSVGLENESNSAFVLKPIQPHQYKLVTTAALNSTNETIHDACVTCRDSGEPQRSATSCLNVSVLEENANRPRFAKPSYFASIAENNRIGAFLLRVRATYPDEGVGGVIEYGLAPDNETERCFTLDHGSGVIRADVVFDFERKRRYKFRVRATDGALRANYAEVDVNVYVLNRNDERPVFAGLPYMFNVPENAPVNSSVGRVIASCADSAPFNVIEYVIVSSASPSFRVDPGSGELSTTRMLDRETEAEYVVEIVACNTGFKSTTATIQVSVLDVNDNAPVISYPARPNNAVYLAADTPVGATVCRVLARDDDIGVNANLTFAVTESSGLFHIDRFSGVITTAARMHRDVSWLRVSVTDQGTPAMTSTAVVVIKLRTSGERSAAGVGHTSAAGAAGVTAIVVGVVCFLVVCLGVFVAAKVIVRGRLVWRQKCTTRGRVQYSCDRDDTILSAYSVDGHVVDTGRCQAVSGVMAEVPRLPRPGILRHPSKVRFADTDAASETSRDVPSLDSGCCHSDETIMTSQMLASYENAYSLGTPRRLAETCFTIPLGNVLHSTPVSCYCPHTGYSNCQCGLTPEFRHVFADSFHEPMPVHINKHDNVMEPTVQWHRADVDSETALTDFSYRRNEETPSGMERADMTTAPSSQTQSPAKTITCESSSGEQDSSNSSSVIL